MSKLTLVIGNKNLSSWSMRPWLLLRHAKIDFEERVFLFEEPGWRDRIVEFSPSGRVPALRHGDDGSLAIWDSLAICEYIADLYPDRGLWPEHRDARAFARAVSAEMHSSFAAMRKDLSMNVTARHSRRTFSKETQSDIDRVIAIWTECRSRFGSSARPSGGFLFGAFSIADAMFAPVVWRFRTCDVPIESREAREWYETMLALESMQDWERDAKAEVAAAAAAAARTSASPLGSRLDPTSAQECFAVIFSSKLKEGAKEAGYDEDVMRMVELAKNDPGFLGIESARGVDGFGVTVSYWDSLEAIARWRAHGDHQKVQARGRNIFYERYEIRVCRVERGSKFPR